MSGNITTTQEVRIAIGRAVEWDIVGKDGRRMGTVDGILQEGESGKVRISGMWCRLQDLPNLRIKAPT